MKKIGIFFGSDTGNTKKIAHEIKKIIIKKKNCNILNISKTNKKDIENCNILFLGIPTWYYGEPQSDWENFFPILKKINLYKKKIAIFGCGDQEDYSEYFCDAMGILNKIIKKNQSDLIGKWSSKGYHFESSKGLIDKNNFVGLAIDEDRQPELTKKRIKIWMESIIQELNL